MQVIYSLLSDYKKLSASLKYGAAALLAIICMTVSLTSTQFANAQDVGVSVGVGLELSIQFNDSESGYNFTAATNNKYKLTRNLVVTTNNFSGFKLYTTGTDGKDTLTSSAASTTFSSITTQQTLANFSGNTWGYSTGSDYASDTIIFSPIPTTSTLIDTAAVTTKTYPVTIGVSTGYAEAGTYSGSMTFTAVAEVSPESYTLIYNDNYPGGQGSFLIVSETDATATHSFTITTQTPTRTGYTFLGWSTEASASTATYVAGNTITLSSTTNPQQTLYAVWQANAQPTPSNPTNNTTNTSNTTTNNTSSGSASNDDDDDSATSGYQSPQGVSEKTTDYENIVEGTDYAPAIVSLSVAVVATAGLIFVIVGKRDDDDDDDEEENGVAQ